MSNPFLVLKYYDQSASALKKYTYHDISTSKSHRPFWVVSKPASVPGGWSHSLRYLAIWPFDVKCGSLWQCWIHSKPGESVGGASLPGKLTPCWETQWFRQEIPSPKLRFHLLLSISYFALKTLHQFAVSRLQYVDDNTEPSCERVVQKHKAPWPSLHPDRAMPHL